MLDVNASIVVRYEGDDTATIVGRHNRDSIDVFRVGERLPPEEHSAFARVLKTGAPARIDDWGGLTGEIAEAIFRVGYRSTAAAPIVVAGALWGAVAIASEDPLPPESEDRLAGVLRASSRWPSPARRRAPTSSPRARAWSRPATSSAAGSSATSTTAPSSASSPSCSSCASRGHG